MASRRGSTGRSTCSTSTWAASPTASPKRSSPARRSSSPTPGPSRSGSPSATTCASPSSTGSWRSAAPAPSPCPPPSPSAPVATTGRCCCGPGRSRTRSSWSQPRRSARRPLTTEATVARSSSTPGAWCWPRRPTGSASSRPSSTLPVRTRSAPACPRSQTDGPAPTAGRRRRPRRRPAPPSLEPTMAEERAVDKRRAILDAAIRVFARQGFHNARVSDVAAEAGVAYGLVYHYFDSKDQMLNELFSERWSLLLEASQEVQRGDVSPREKLGGVAGFIIESYRHNPELMKVIIVEVTRAANSFGRTHLPEIRQAYEQIEKIVSDAQQTGEFRDDVDPNFSAMVFYGAIEQLLTGWIFDLIPATNDDYERAKQLVIETICGGLEPRPVGDAVAG